MAQPSNSSNPNPAEKPEQKDLQGTPAIKYTDDEVKYATYLQTRLENARSARNTNHDEFDGMTYTQYYESNLKGANSFIAPKKNREDTTFVTGTTRQALLAMTAKINQLNLAPEVKAFDKNDHEDVHTGQAMQDILTKADELDNDDLKKILRQYEMYAQGTVFVEEAWTEEFRTNKQLNDKKWNGQVTDVNWTERLERVFEGCRRNLLPGLNVFLGSIKEFHMEQQPYVFTVDYISYDEAKAQYGEWERWKYVTRDLQRFSQDVPQTIYMNNWRLQVTQKDQVEVIKYQDKWKNEYMVLLNGVMMVPIGFPLPWKYAEYNIVKNVFEIITPYFAYGGSLIKKLKTAQALEDEFWRLAILKTQKSFQPPRSNMTGKLLSSRIFMPGKISPGIDPNQVKTFDENNEGITTSEANMLQMIKQNLHDNSLPQLSQGQDPQGDPSATEIMQLQQEAKSLLGLAVFSAALLEKKLAELRLYDILENWFEPYDTEADEIRGEIRDKYRSASVSASIEGRGKGRRMVKVTDKMPKQSPSILKPDGTPGESEIYDEEERLSQQEGHPVQVIYLNAKEIKSVKYNWFIVVNPREKESSALSKSLFNTMLAGMQQIGQTAQLFPGMNLDFIEERFAEVWDMPADKAFTKQAQATLAGNPMPMPGQGGPAQPPPTPGTGAIPAQIQQGAKAPLQVQKPSLNTMVK
jgi:hypothetical protein